MPETSGVSLLGVLLKLVELFASALAGFVLAWYWYAKGDLKERVDDLIVQIRSMEETGCEYWGQASSSSNDAALEIRIRRLSNKVGSIIGTLNRNYRAFRFESMEPLTEFRRAITESPFEAANRPSDRPRCTRISDAANVMERAVRTACRHQSIF